MIHTSQQTSLLPNSTRIAWVLVLGIMPPMLDSTMVNIAIHQLNIDLNTSLSMIQWVITAFILAMGAAVPFSSWLTDHFSGKKVFFWSELVFGCTSLMAGLVQNVDILILVRVIQGFSSGLMAPIMFTILVDYFGGDKMGQVMSIIGLPMTLGPMTGPIVGGLIVQYLSWRWMFCLNVPLAILSAYLLVKVVPNISPKNKLARFDFIGVTLLITASVSLIFGIVQASNVGSFNNFLTISFVIIGFVAIFVYIIYAFLNKNEVVLPLRLFRHRNFSGIMIANILAGFITSGPMLLLPLYFQDVRGDNSALAAVGLIPQSIGMLISRGVIGKMIDSIGARWVVLLGVIITIIGTLPFVYFDSQSVYVLIAAALFVRGIGGAAVKSAIQADAYVGISKADSAKASLGSKLSEQIGAAFSSAVLATIVASYIAQHHILHMTQLSSAYRHGFLYATLFSIAIIIPGLLLTNRVKKESH